jgi:cyanophycinase
MQQLLFLAAIFSGQGPSHPVGHLIIAGGGPTSPEIIAKAVALAGGPQKAHVLIIPQASMRPDAGQRSQELWRNTRPCPADVKVLNLKERLDTQEQKAALAAIRDANLIWMPGGSQSRLMEMLQKNNLVKAIQERFDRGATVGGTSAGAAVMSSIMLTAQCRWDSVCADAIEGKTSQGLGLWPEVIFDQHFFRRARFNRLFSAVLINNKKVGIGIDEGSAIVVEGGHFEVVGKSNVLVIDARHAKDIIVNKGEPGAATSVLVHCLRPGMKFDFKNGVIQPARVIAAKKSVTGSH